MINRILLVIVNRHFNFLFFQNQYSLARAQQSFKSLVQIHEKNGKTAFKNNQINKKLPSYIGLIIVKVNGRNKLVHDGSFTSVCLQVFVIFSSLIFNLMATSSTSCFVHVPTWIQDHHPCKVCIVRMFHVNLYQKMICLYHLYFYQAASPTAEKTFSCMFSHIKADCSRTIVE